MKNFLKSTKKNTTSENEIRTGQLRIWTITSSLLSLSPENYIFKIVTRIKKTSIILPKYLTYVYPYLGQDSRIYRHKYSYLYDYIRNSSKPISKREADLLVFKDKLLK